MADENIAVQDTLVTVGQVVAERYEVVKHLGTGGFAKVFKAFDRLIEREVAIKFLDLRSIHASDQMIHTILERFRREAKLAARIQHRNVVNIYDIGTLHGQETRPFIVMELLNGFDLEDQLTDTGPLEPARLLPLYVDCLDALGEAHDLGIVHKDLKPSNLFLSNPGERSESLRIVDFGIAHIKSGGQDAPTEEEPSEESKPGRGNRLTATGQILGTLQYLTPEYIAGQIVTPALDVYQMALILVELLSGERVIKTDNPFECLRIHTFGLLELPEYLLQSPLGDVLRKALHSEHTERYQDAKAFADALSQIDPADVPPSPMLTGDASEGQIRTAQFLKSTSSPAIPSPNTSNFSRPTTDEFAPSDAGDDAMLDTMDAPEEAVSELRQELDIARGAAAPKLRASASGESDRSTALAAVPDGEQPFVTDNSSKAGLVVAAILVLGLVAAAAGGVVMLLDDPNGEAQAEPAPEPIASKEEPPAKEDPPAVPEKSTEPEVTPPPEVTSEHDATPEPDPEPKQPEVKKVAVSKRKKSGKHEVLVTAVPSSAKISYRHDRSCSNPCKVRLERREKRLQVKVTAKGYEERVHTVTRDDERITLELARTKPSVAEHLPSEAELARIKREQEEKERLEREAREAALANKRAEEEARKKELAEKAPPAEAPKKDPPAEKEDKKSATMGIVD